MAEFDFNSRILAGHYVFYQRLLQSEKPELQDLGNKAKASLDKVMASSSGVNLKAISQLYKMANIEAQKETQLLEKIFSIPLDVNLNDPDFYRNLIDGLNRALNVEKVYERNIKRIEAGETHISIARWYPDYFNRAWTELLPTILDRLTTAIGNTNRKVSIGNIAAATLRELMPDINNRAIELMFESQDFKNQDNSDQSYKELIESFKNLNAGQEFAQQLYKLYNLDTLADELAKSIKDKNKKERYKDLTKKTSSRASIVKVLHRSNEAALGGSTAEFLENFIVNAFVDAKMPSNISIQAYHSGNTKMKADNIISIEINPAPIMDAMARAGADRTQNVEALTALNEQLKQIKNPNSFIIYSNAKNYALLEGNGDYAFNKRGFSSGEDITLSKLQTVLTKTNIQPYANEFIGAIENTLKDALGEGNLDQVERMLATDFAYFLFDDVATIGQETGGAQALHIFNLDGTYIPLSFLCYLLAQAMEQTANDNFKHFITAYVNFNGVKIFDEGEDSGMARWNQQRKIALTKMKVGMRFLSNFREVIKSLHLLD